MDLYLHGKTGKMYYVLIEQKALKQTEGRSRASIYSTSITVYNEKPKNRKQMGICGTVLPSDYVYSVMDMVKELIEDCDRLTIEEQ